MRLALVLALVGTTTCFTLLASPPIPQKMDEGQAVLKAMEGQWTLASATAATPECIITSVFDNPSAAKPGVRVTKGVFEMTMKGELVPGSRNTLEIGTDPACLLLTPIVEPGQNPKPLPFKCRIKIDGDTLTLVQDHSRPDEYPESFDPRKGRDRGRAVTVFIREKDKR